MADRRTLDAFVAELRRIGLPVSVAENVDAMAAIGAMPIRDRAALKSALGATLVKSGSHYPVFEQVFDLFFGDGRVGSDHLEGPAYLADPEAGGEAGHETPDEDTGGAVNGAQRPGSGGAGLVAALDDAELADLLFRGILTSNRLLVRSAVAEAVTRYAGMEPGRAAGGVYYLSRTLSRLDLDRLAARLAAADSGAQQSAIDASLAAERRRGQLDDVRAEVEAEIRRRLVADRGAAAVAATLRVSLPEDVNLLSASAEQRAAIGRTLRVLGRKLAARLARKRRHHRRSALDFRRTIRESLGTGGIPADLVFRKPHPAKPEIMLVVDVSSSVSTFAAFTLQLAYALRSEFSRVRSFVFTDGIEEVTDVLESAADISSVARQINSRPGVVRFDGHSDYGTALEDFWNRWGTQIGARTSVIILGDARNNYRASRVWALRAVRRRARHVYWLNPEPGYLWDTGDSIVSAYAEHCDEVVECRNLRQLTEFVEALD
jgi:uncharacterized protein with von Willebrand factor type A (vWA) domain